MYLSILSKLLIVFKEDILLQIIISIQINNIFYTTLQKPKREFLKRSFKYSGAMLWNQLPSEVKLAESMHSFNKYIKM